MRLPWEVINTIFYSCGWLYIFYFDVTENGVQIESGIDNAILSQNNKEDEAEEQEPPVPLCFCGGHKELSEAKGIPFVFGADAFGVSIKTVTASLLHYRNYFSERNNLPSWDTN
jgi:hypothetical protein